MHLIHVYVIGLHKKITAAQVFFFNLNVYKAIFHSNWGEVLYVSIVKFINTRVYNYVLFEFFKMFSLFLWYFSNLSDVGLYIFQVLYMKILEFCRMARVKKSQERLVRTMSPRLNYATDRDERTMWV